MADAPERFFYEGRKAFYNYKVVSTDRGEFKHLSPNPYTFNSFRGKEWQRGYNAGYFENLTRLNKRRADQWAYPGEKK